MICIFVPNSIVSHAAALIDEEKRDTGKEAEEAIGGLRGEGDQ